MFDRKTLRCFGHLINMDSNIKPRQAWETKIEGLEGRVRPRIEWEEHVRTVMREGITLLEVTKLVKVRKAFQIWLMNLKARKGSKA
jgi:hypothetical protein